MFLTPSSQDCCAARIPQLDSLARVFEGPTCVPAATSVQCSHMQCKLAAAPAAVSKDLIDSPRPDSVPPPSQRGVLAARAPAAARRRQRAAGAARERGLRRRRRGRRRRRRAERAAPGGPGGRAVLCSARREVGRRASQDRILEALPMVSLPTSARCRAPATARAPRARAPAGPSAAAPARAGRRAPCPPCRR